MRVILLLSAMLTAAVTHAAPINIKSLLAEMTDMKLLAQVPDPGYTTLQFSSYDRRSTDPTVQTDENWYANGDRGNHLRSEERNGETEWVMMDAAGPGAIVRFWSANPVDAGIVRIYLDGASAPLIEMPMTELLGGKERSFAMEQVSGVRGAGWNCYLPIPFAQHCKVTASKPDFYYIINYREYDTGAEVTSLTGHDISDAVDDDSAFISDAFGDIVGVRDALRSPGFDPQLQLATSTLKAGETQIFCEVKGPNAFYAFGMLVDAADNERALRQVVLRMTFDGKETVVAPLGDFFGSAPGLNPYVALPMGVMGKTMYCQWYMPFRESASMSLSNYSEMDVPFSWTTTKPFKHEEPVEQLLFHAKWRTEADIPTRPRRDWNHAMITGEGRLVGSSLYIANPVKDWWGEGDEKIYIDGAAYPQWFGTGSEDFYGYAWCDNHTFSHAYHNQPRVDGPGNFGHTSVNRFLIMDNIPFKESLRFDMEVWHWKETKVTQSAMVYWYATAESTDNFPPIDPATLVIPALPDPPQARVIPHAVEGEKMRVVQVDGGKAEVQRVDAIDWSNGEQMWWLDGAPGNKLVLGFNVKRAGKYEVGGVFTKAPDYGIATVQVNGDAASKPFDFYVGSVLVTDPPLALGVHELKEGENTLTVTITGANEQAVKRHMIGVDCLVLKAAR